MLKDNDFREKKNLTVVLQMAGIRAPFITDNHMDVRLPIGNDAGNGNQLKGGSQCG